MAIPLSPEEQARVDAYWTSAPQSPAAAPAMSAAPDPAMASYWGGATAPGPDLPPVSPPSPPSASAPPPYQPNPGLPNYQPNPGATTEVAPRPPGPSTAPSASDFALGAKLSEPPMPVLQQEALRQSRLGGPTAADNAAFEQFKASQGAPKPAAAGRGGPANPDPYGIGAAQRAQLASFDTRVGAMGRAATAEQDRAVIVADHEKNLARMQEEDAAIARAEQEYTAKHFDEQMTEIGRQLDDVRTRKVDPLKDFKETPALGVLAVAGGVVSGFYQGLTGGQQNEFLADLDRKIDRGIAEQERQIREEKFVLNEGGNMLQLQRQAQKDDALAKMQLRNLSYEAVKNEIAADAERAGTDIAKANADAAISAVQGQQAQLQEQIARQKMAQAQAAASQAHARNKEVQATYKETYKEVLQATGSPAQAEAEARRAVGVIYAPGSVGPRAATGVGADPVMALPKDRRDEGAKEFTAHSNAEKSIGAMSTAFGQWGRLPTTAGPWDRDREALQANILASYKSGLGPGMSSDNDAKKFLEPLMPAYGDSDATLKRKQELIAQSIRSKVSTPTLDAHAPGWRQPTTQEADATIGAKPVR